MFLCNINQIWIKYQLNINWISIKYDHCPYLLCFIIEYLIDIWLSGVEKERNKIRQWFDDEVGIYEKSDIYYKLFINSCFDGIKLIERMTLDDLETIGVDKVGHTRQ